MNRYESLVSFCFVFVSKESSQFRKSDTNLGNSKLSLDEVKNITMNNYYPQIL